MSVQIIKKDGKPEWAVVPFDTYERLVQDAEMLQDIRDYDEAMSGIEAGEELIQSEVVYAVLDGENPIRIWRKHRGLTLKQLAERAGVSIQYLSQIESGKRAGTAKVLASIAKGLGVTVDDLVTA
jgi:DNA-binding XRE family transcriptional regulator